MKNSCFLSDKLKSLKMKMKSVKAALKSNALTLATLAGVLIGIILGVCLRTREEQYTQREAMYVKFIGSLFLQMLKCIIIPLIIPSLIVAVGSLDLKISGMKYQRVINIQYIVRVLRGTQKGTQKLLSNVFSNHP